MIASSATTIGGVNVRPASRDHAEFITGWLSADVNQVTTTVDPFALTTGTVNGTTCNVPPIVVYCLTFLPRTVYETTYIDIASLVWRPIAIHGNRAPVRLRDIGLATIAGQFINDLLITDNPACAEPAGSKCHTDSFCMIFRHRFAAGHVAAVQPYCAYLFTCREQSYESMLCVGAIVVR